MAAKGLWPKGLKFLSALMTVTIIMVSILIRQLPQLFWINYSRYDDDRNSDDDGDRWGFFKGFEFVFYFKNQEKLKKSQVLGSRLRVCKDDDDRGGYDDDESNYQVIQVMSAWWKLCWIKVISSYKDTCRVTSSHLLTALCIK